MENKQLTFDVTQSHTVVLPVTGNLPTFGFTVFWTVTTGTWDQTEMDQWAKDLPPVIKQCLRPNDLVSSFEKATNLEGEHKRVVDLLPHEDKELVATWTSRKLKDTSTERILLREVLSRTGKRVSLLNVGTISLDSSTGEITLHPSLDCESLPSESIDIFQKSLQTLVDEITNEITSRSSGVEGQKIRTGIQKWVDNRHGLSLRGRGGVYFVPHTRKGTTDYRTTVLSEILSIQKFLSDNKLGSLFAIEILQTESFSKEDLIDTLMGELTLEIDDVMVEIESTSTPSLRRIKGQQIKIAALREKAKLLNDTFNNKFTHFGIKLGQTQKSIKQIETELSNKGSET